MKLIRFQMKLILNKITVLLLFITSLLIVFVYLLELLSLDKEEANNSNVYTFFTSTYFYYKLIITFISIYLFSSVISIKGDYSLYTLRMFNYKRAEVMFSKILSCFFIILILCVISFTIFMGLGLLINGFYMNNDYINAYMNGFLLCISYGLLSMICMQLFQNYFVMIVICVLSLFIGGIEEENIFIQIIFFLFPKVEESGVTYYGVFHLIWINLIEILLNYFVYYQRDLNY